MVWQNRVRFEGAIQRRHHSTHGERNSELSGPEMVAPWTGKTLQGNENFSCNHYWFQLLTESWHCSGFQFNPEDAIKTLELGNVGGVFFLHGTLSIFAVLVAMAEHFYARLSRLNSGT